MATAEQAYLRSELQRRHDRLQSALRSPSAEASLSSLLDQVDAALTRMDQGTYGICKACHTPIETDRLLADPLLQFCLDDLTREERHEVSWLAIVGTGIPFVLALLLGPWLVRPELAGPNGNRLSLIIILAVGVAVTSASVVLFGEAIWDPVVLLGRFNQPVVALVVTQIMLRDHLRNAIRRLRLLMGILIQGQTNRITIGRTGRSEHDLADPRGRTRLEYVEEAEHIDPGIIDRTIG